MYTKKEIENSLFFDIETASKYPSFKEFEEKEKNLSKLWAEKYHPSNYKKEMEKNPTIYIYTLDEIYNKYAGLYPEFSKVICISFGLLIKTDKNTIEKEITNVSSHNEVDLLKDTKLFFNSLKNMNLTGFNIKGFDIPFLCKRFLINGIELPELLKIKGKKPWELTVIDIMDDWKFGSFGNNTSLDVLCETLGVVSPKDDIQNYQVSEVYHQSKDNLSRIEKYCAKDVKATMEVMERLVL